MPETIQQIVSDLARRLGAWLPQPDNDATGLQEVEEGVQAYASLLGATATKGLRRALQNARENALAVRWRRAADEISKACREHLIRKEPVQNDRRASADRRGDELHVGEGGAL